MDTDPTSTFFIYIVCVQKSKISIEWCIDKVYNKRDVFIHFLFEIVALLYNVKVKGENYEFYKCYFMAFGY